MKLIIFHCKIDNNGRGSWIVAKEEATDVFLGIAECPDKHTAVVIKEAMELREEHAFIEPRCGDGCKGCSACYRAKNAYEDGGRDNSAGLTK